MGLPEPVPRVRRNSHSNPPSSSSNNNSKNGIAAAGAKVAIDVEGLLRADPVTAIDLTAALKTTKPSSDGKMTKYVLHDLRVAVLYCTVLCTICRPWVGLKRTDTIYYFFSLI